MNIIFFDDSNRIHLLPLTFTRPCAALRTGILTINEKWEKHLGNGNTYSYLTEVYLQPLFPQQIAADNLLINGTVLPDATLVSEIQELKTGEGLYSGNVLVAVRLDESSAKGFTDSFIPNHKKDTASAEVLKLRAPYDIFMLNDKAIRRDYELLTKGRTSQAISDTNKVLGTEVFIEPGAVVECAILNAKTGPIYIGVDAEVMEGSAIRGPFALCEHSQLKLNTKIYGPTTIGPHSKIGGEVTRSVVQGYSNKGHDGFLGDSVLGYWCNLGADTNNSNLKNNYAEVKLWDYESNRFKKTGLQFCGLIMGDHSKCGINTMFNTGTVVGICSNIFGSGFPRNFVPDFAWGGAQGFETYRPGKVFETAELVYKRRGLTMSDAEKAVLVEVFNQTAKHRFWEPKTEAVV